MKGLPLAARRLLQNRPGTQEVRKLMRFATHAGRIRRGVPIFVTFSPDGKHNILLLRPSRCRRNDPANEVDPLSRRFGGRLVPELGADFVELGVPLEDLLDRLPSYEDWRAMMARDPLASVDGFRVLCSWPTSTSSASGSVPSARTATTPRAVTRCPARSSSAATPRRREASSGA